MIPEDVEERINFKNLLNSFGVSLKDYHDAYEATPDTPDNKRKLQDASSSTPKKINIDDTL